MTGLLLKDWKLLRKQGKYFLVVFLIALAIAAVNSMSYSAFMTCYMTVIFTTFTITSFSYDEQDNGMLYLLGLPIDRETYVKEKYVFGLILGCGSWLLSLVIRIVLQFIQVSDIDWKTFVGVEPFYLAVILLLLGLSLPCVVKYGAEKGRQIFFGVLLGMIVLFVVLFQTGIFYITVRTVDFYLKAYPYGLTYGLLAASVFLLIGSYILSVRLIEKKEY